MRTHEQKKVLKECEGDEAKEVEHFILDVLSKHDLASVNPVASIVGLTNALLTVATRLDIVKESFFTLAFLSDNKPAIGKVTLDINFPLLTITIAP